MTWRFVGQLLVLACGLIVVVCAGALHGSIVDKRREDDYKRKENGL